MAARSPLRVGVVGCGNISDIYLLNAPRFRDIVVTACADLNSKAAERQAERYAIDARSVEDLLKSDDVDIVLNLTIPEAHAEVSLKALEARKHDREVHDLGFLFFSTYYRWYLSLIHI